MLNAGAPSALLLLGDHAGREIPARLNGLGLTAADLDRHIAWDIGIAGLGTRLSALLNAPFIRQVYSRLVVDCNRRPEAKDAIPEISDGTPIPGNRDLSPLAIATRLAEIYQPYQDAIAEALERRAGRRTVLVALHSFTPSMAGQDRPWRLGVLHRHDSAFSSAMLARLRADLDEAFVGDNAPYAMDETDNTIPLHADPRGLDYLELEVRQDLLADETARAEMAQWLAPRLQAVLDATSMSE
ncbi:MULTISPECIES: N-formylglutamate amidohydrolase [unclassified Caulobacter]|uniref:N-formylglutamate amidohydrolase n=1 Tax=unclassified Caulobacter TaxID=2648921 RepID=UPI000B13311B|nr:MULTISPECIES: N-formylglutamate amidohydrolase [unclassified Caulobacter]